MKDQIQIILELGQGKFDTVGIATKRAVERICTDGAMSKFGDMLKTYWWAFGIALVLVAWLIFRK